MGVKELELQDLFSLGDVEDGFQLYIQDLELRFPEWLEGQAQENDTSLYLLLTYYYFLNYLADSSTLDAEQGSYLLASKASTDLFAIYSCLRNGCVHQASLILRSLFETAVTTTFIYDDLENRMQLFMDSKYIEKYQAIKRDSSIIPESEHAEIIRMYRRIKHKYTPRSSWYSKLLLSIIDEDAKLRSKYRKPTFKALCEVVQMNDDYDRLYGSLSLTVHGSPVVDHLFVSKGNFTAAPVFNSLQIKTISSLAIHYAHFVFRHILEKSNNQKAKRMIEYSLWLLYASAKIAQDTNGVPEHES